MRGPRGPQVSVPPVQQVVREEGPAADPHSARAREAPAAQVHRVRQELQPVVESEQAHAGAQWREAVQVCLLQ